MAEKIVFQAGFKSIELFFLSKKKKKKTFYTGMAANLTHTFLLILSSYTHTKLVVVKSSEAATKCFSKVFSSSVYDDGISFLFLSEGRVYAMWDRDRLYIQT